MDERERRLLELGSATVYEAAGRVGALDPAIQAVSGERLIGRALPVRCHPGDNLGVHQAVAEAEEGDVLVIAGEGVRVGYLGDVLGEAARVRGVRGAVVDGTVRDVADLREVGFAVWARGTAIIGAAKSTPGTVGDPAVCGGVEVSRGDLIVADLDGVACVAAAAVESVLAAAERRAESEEDFRARLRQGELTLDLFGLRDSL